MPNSRDKGARGEREFANWLTEQGFPARRGQQFSGGPDSPDVVCEALSAFQFEVKRTERFRLYPAMKQAEEDAGEDRIPVVAHRMNHKKWVIVMDAEDWINYIQAQFPVNDDV